MPTYRNTDVETRVFPHITNPQTGRTLELAPGETVELPGRIDPSPHLGLVGERRSHETRKPAPEAPEHTAKAAADPAKKEGKS